MGGKPKTHTPYDRRLIENRDRPPHNSPLSQPAGPAPAPKPAKPAKAPKKSS